MDSGRRFWCYTLRGTSSRHCLPDSFAGDRTGGVRRGAGKRQDLEHRGAGDMVKAFVRHKVADFAAWKQAFDEFLPQSKGRR
jgi:hypothetical protein